MLFFFHLFAGIVLGLLMGDLLRDRRWVLPVIIGSVLPDLIDKPVGYFLFPDLFGSGRIFMHSIVIAGGMVALGILFWKYWAHPEVLAIAFGILFHQVLDMMWEMPEDWLFPIFGLAAPPRGVDYTFAIFLRDFRAASEWVLAFAIICAIALIILLWHDRSIVSRHRTFWAGLLGAGAFISVVLGGVIIGIGVSRANRNLLRAFSFFGWDDRMQFIIGGIIFITFAFVLWRMRRRIIQEKSVWSSE